MQFKKNMAITALGGFLTGAAFNYTLPHKEVACTVCFTPGGTCTKLIVESINSAKHEILVQAYSFTSPEIAEALIRAHRRGLKVICIFDKSQDKKIMILKIISSGIPTFIDHPQGIAHNKVMIIDDSLVLTGSFNFTKAAQFRNVENSIHLRGEKLVREYKDQWLARKQVSKKVNLNDSTSEEFQN